jgi:hypothetical protein
LLTTRAVVDFESAAKLMDTYHERREIELSLIGPYNKAAVPTPNNPIQRIVSLGEFLQGSSDDGGDIQANRLSRRLSRQRMRYFADDSLLRAALASHLADLQKAPLHKHI